MWQRILVATDGSAMAQRAETVGIETAECFGADLVFVHVVAEDGPRDDEYDGLAQALGAIGPVQVGSVHQENLAESVAQATGAQGVETHRDALRAFGDCVLKRAAERRASKPKPRWGPATPPKRFVT
jgi:nucleotide-binding universal stress UspA family protein